MKGAIGLRIQRTGFTFDIETLTPKKWRNSGEMNYMKNVVSASGTFCLLFPDFDGPITKLSKLVLHLIDVAHERQQCPTTTHLFSVLVSQPPQPTCSWIIQIHVSWGTWLVLVCSYIWLYSAQSTVNSLERRKRPAAISKLLDLFDTIINLTRV